jgi:hypothetical protein
MFALKQLNFTTLSRALCRTETHCTPAGCRWISNLMRAHFASERAFWLHHRMHSTHALGVVAVINEHPASVYAEKKHCHLVACDSTSETARRQAALSCCREVGGEVRRRGCHACKFASALSPRQCYQSIIRCKKILRRATIKLKKIILKEFKLLLI